MKENEDKKQNLNQEINIDDVPKNTKATVKRLLNYFASQKKKLILIIMATFLSCVTYAFTPLFVGVAIDNLWNLLKEPNLSTGLLSAVTDALWQPILVLILIGVSSSVLAYFQQYMVASVGENLTLSLRKEVSKKLTKLPLRFFDSHETGDILSRTTNDIEKVSDVLQVGLMQFISSVFIVIVTIFAMLFLNPLLTVLVLVTLGISMYATKLVSEKSQYYFAKNQAALGELNGKIEEIYTANTTIKIYNGQQDAIESVLKLSEKQYETEKRAQFTNYAIYPAIRLINQLGFIVTAIVGGSLAIQGRLSIGMVQAFLQYVNQVSEPATEASYVITSLQAAIAGAERVFELLDEEEEVEESIKETKVKEISKGQVDFSHVRFGYHKEKILMKDINLKVRPNEMVAIVGPTGGGKTTLINLLMRFYEIDGGKITIDGIDIRSMKRGELRRQIGMVLQDTWLFEGTIAENISYGNKNATKEQIIAAAKAARCDYFIRTLPKGYDTILSSDAISLSQGQMQLLTIARAMLADPSIMILDEATSNVDTRTEVEIQKAMSKMMQGKTSFVIAHRLSTIRNANLILVVKDGNIVETGTHDSLLKEQGFYASLYNSQFSA